MRLILAGCAAVALSSFTVGQAPPRFIEVQVTDTARLPFAGLDYEVRMPSPFDLAAQSMPEDYNDKAVGRAIDEGAAKAKEMEERFLAILKQGSFEYRLSSTEHAEDYAYGTDRKYDVNTYLVQLRNAPEMERFFKATDGTPEFVGNMKDQHFADPSSVASRLMKKLYLNARLEAEALAAVANVGLGNLISAQELTRTEGSILEQLFLMDKRGDDADAQAMMLSTHTTSMAFRFELLP